MTNEHLDRHQLETAVMLYIQEVRGIPMRWVTKVRFPVYDAQGNIGAVAEINDGKEATTETGTTGQPPCGATSSA